jgi:carbon storage regulator
MLVLKRKAGEILLLGDNIEVRILSVEGEQVRIGIIAPQTVQVLRGELLEDVRAETAMAAKPGLGDVRAFSSQLRKHSQAAALAPASNHSGR